MILHPLFHWSPSTRRAGICRRGLVLTARPVANEVPMGYVCLSPSAREAWLLSAAVSGQRGEDWDCWQVTLGPGDDVRERRSRGDRAEEVRVRNRIPKSRVWLVGTRTVPPRGRRW